LALSRRSASKVSRPRFPEEISQQWDGARKIAVQALPEREPGDLLLGRSSSSEGWQRWFFTGIGMAAALFIV
jgi:hypothetical protein